MPLTWEELATAHPLDFRITNAPARLAETGDRWADVLDIKQDLEAALARSQGGARRAEPPAPNPAQKSGRRRKA